MRKRMGSIMTVLAVVVLMGQGCPAQQEVEPSADGTQPAQEQTTEDEGTEEASTDNGDQSALSDNEQQLVGTWKHIRSEGGRFPGPIESDVTWTFNADGTGTYYQKPQGMSASSRDIDWSLDEEGNIYFSSEPTGDPTYRVDVWGENEMKWHNYTLGDTYVVEQQ